MKEYEKDNKRKKENGNAPPPFYSYIERDVIDNYYSKKRAKKRIITGISLVSLIIILWNFYAILTWVNPVYKSITNRNLPFVSAVSASLDANGVKQREMIKYLAEMKLLSAPFKDFWAKKDAIGKNIAVLKEMQTKIQNAVTTIKQTKVPDYLKTYHALKVEQADYSLQTCSELVLAMQSTDDATYFKHCDLCNEAIKQFNAMNVPLQNEMFRVFDEIGMVYNITSTGVNYNYKS